MHLQAYISSSALLLGAVAAYKNFVPYGATPGIVQEPSLYDSDFEFQAINGHRHDARQTRPNPRFLNANTTRFAVNGTGIPDVTFDAGESYAGLLPISRNPADPNGLFFWFFPSINPTPEREIVIWLNGGPGCSSLMGLMQENGPIFWQKGTFRPVSNPWSWTNLTNVVWIEQPVGTGYSTGIPTVTNEKDVASQFLGFWRNFINTFSMQGYKVYITGESYAGMYCPYIADAMLNANNKTYYNMSGLMIYDPSIAREGLQQDITVMGLVKAWPGVFPFNDTFSNELRGRDIHCGFTEYMNKGLSYPPAGPLPVKLPGEGDDQCESMFNAVFSAASDINACFNIYQVSATCPILWDIIGFPTSFPYVPAGTTFYFDRADVKRALHAPANSRWRPCSERRVFVNGTDNSEPSALTVLPGVIDRTQNVIIGHGALDMVMIANGTLLAIQNMTWGGKLGFQNRPASPFFVPYHREISVESYSASGVLGVTHKERGLTYVGIEMAGHMVPQFQPAAAFRHLEVLLGRVPDLSSTAPFTTPGQREVRQPEQGDLGGPPKGAVGSAPACGAGENDTRGGGGGGGDKGGGGEGQGSGNSSAAATVTVSLFSVLFGCLALFL
ncbi:hypothetical protein RB594_008197 [Gaeumannomyces avenae]